MIGSFPFGKNTPISLGGIRIYLATADPGSLADEANDQVRRLAVRQFRLNLCGGHRRVSTIAPLKPQIVIDAPKCAGHFSTQLRC